MAKNFFKRAVDLLRGKPSDTSHLEAVVEAEVAGSMDVTMAPEKPPEPKNYRAIDFNIGGRHVQIAGMASPSLKGQDPKEVIDFLKKQGYTTLISLDYNASNEKIAKKAGLDHVNQHVTDFTAPSIEQLDLMYTNVCDCVASGGKVAIHCREGLGRTGTVLAAIKIKELILAAPMEALKNQTPSESVQLGHYGGNKKVACTPMVKKAIELVRAHQSSGHSVENQMQVDQLCAYEHVVLSKN